jgi:DNA-binding NarL/FixJ family response regulator
VSDAPVRVLIADDHVALRSGTRMALEDAGFEVVAEAGDARSAVEAALREKPDICLLDIKMPGSGIEAAAEISRVLPKTAVVMLTISEDDDDLFNAIRAGAVGYLLKGTDPDRLPHALRGVLAGEAAIPRTLVRRVIEELGDRRRRRVQLLDGTGVELTGREWEILSLLREGLKTSVIAERLGISRVTVRRHVSGILTKLDVPDREAAVARFEELGQG